MKLLSINRTPTRALAALAVASLLAAGCAQSASPDRAQARPASSPHATSVAHQIDMPALWQLLGAMPPAERDNVVSGLPPNVRAGLAAIANQAAIAAR
jgi:hypothetical protein